MISANGVALLGDPLNLPEPSHLAGSQTADALTCLINNDVITLDHLRERENHGVPPQPLLLVLGAFHKWFLQFHHQPTVPRKPQHEPLKPRHVIAVLKLLTQGI